MMNVIVVSLDCMLYQKWLHKAIWSISSIMHLYYGIGVDRTMKKNVFRKIPTQSVRTLIKTDIDVVMQNVDEYICESLDA